jgi:hypothetical protein
MGPWKVVSALRKEPQRIPLPVYCVGAVRSIIFWTPNLPALYCGLATKMKITERRNFLLFLSHPVCDVLLQQLEWTKTYMEGC